MGKRFIIFLLSGLPCGAFAGTFNYLGFGARNQGMANSTAALPTDGLSQAYNPALMAFQHEKVFTIGIEGAVTSFTPINQVVVNTPTLGASSVVVGDVDTSTQDSFLYAIGYQTPLYKADHPVHFGFTIVGPVQRIFSMQTPNDFQPEYSMYTSDTQRIVPGAALALNLTDDFAIGAGANLYFAEGTNSTETLNNGGGSHGVIATDVSTGLAPELGVVWAVSPHVMTGLSYRGKQDYRSQINIDAQISLLGQSDLVYNNVNSLAYDPDMFMAAVSVKNDSGDTFAGTVKYEAWGGYNGGAVVMNFQSYTGSFSQTLPSTPFHDIYTYHVGYEHKYVAHTLRAGYAFVPTPAPNPNTFQSSNILDSDKHEFYAGWGYRWDHFFLDGTLDLDLVAFADYLVPYTVTKNNNQQIGYPGYSVGGTIFGYGMTLTREY